MPTITLTPRRIPHEIVETTELVDTFDEHHPDLVRAPKAGKPGTARVVARTNAIEMCPDCGRALQAVRDDLAPVHVLVCPQLEAIDLAALEDLTPADVVACGQSISDEDA